MVALLQATFELSLVVPLGLMCLSNMPLKSVENIGTRALHSFETSPQMSVHLVAWVAADFISVDTKMDLMEGEKPLNIWGPSQRSVSSL